MEWNTDAVSTFSDSRIFLVSLPPMESDMLALAKLLGESSKRSHSVSRVLHFSPKGVYLQEDVEIHCSDCNKSAQLGKVRTARVNGIKRSGILLQQHHIRGERSQNKFSVKASVLKTGRGAEGGTGVTTSA